MSEHHDSIAQGVAVGCVFCIAADEAERAELPERDGAAVLADIVADRFHLTAQLAEVTRERDEWKACAARTGTERRSDEMRAIHERDSARAEADRMRPVYEAALAVDAAEQEAEKYTGIDTPPAIKARQNTWRTMDAMRAVIASTASPRKQGE
jgi:hypothetical protein